MNANMTTLTSIELHQVVEGSFKRTQEAQLPALRALLSGDRDTRDLNERQIDTAGANYLDTIIQVQRYQKAHDVSGLIWKEVSYRGLTVRVPQPGQGLILLPKDRVTLREERDTIVSWWLETTQGNIYRKAIRMNATPLGGLPTNPKAIRRTARIYPTAWVGVFVEDDRRDGPCTKLFLVLGDFFFSGLEPKRLYWAICPIED